MRSGSSSAYLIAARIAGALRPKWRRSSPSAPPNRAPGITVVIPSRNGRELLAAQLDGIIRDLAGIPSEIIVVDNGSTDGTASWLDSVRGARTHACRAETHPGACEHPILRTVVNATPLSFARAVNCGIAIATYSHVCLLNNDMLLAPGFFRALLQAFDRVPDLFCATAQIRFPSGVRREETGKAVMAQSHPEDFPLRCDEPLPGEDHTWVLYGSGGCSLYDAAKLQTLGNMDESYEPAYVEDLDLGYRAWLRAWPSVYVAGAVVEHRHRATTSRYYTEAQLQEVLEVNYLKFLTRAVSDRRMFRRLWHRAVDRLAAIQSRAPAAAAALRHAWQIPFEGGELIEPACSEELFLALTDGSAAAFPGQGTGPLVLACAGLLSPPPADLLRRFAEIVVVRGPQHGPAHRAALAWTKRKWSELPVSDSAAE